MRLLRHALGISWRDYVTNEELYGDLPKISDVVRRRWLQFAGHRARSDELATDAVLWQPNGNRNRGRPAHTYRRLLEKDTGLCAQELRTAMLSRTNWRYHVMGSGEPPDWLIDWLIDWYNHICIYMSFKWNEEECPSALGVSLCDRHGALQMSVIISWT